MVRSGEIFAVLLAWLICKRRHFREAVAGEHAAQCVCVVLPYLLFDGQ